MRAARWSPTAGRPGRFSSICCRTRSSSPRRAARSRFGYTIVIEDTGIGIEDGQLPHLFEPFRQADETIAREYGGTGLGLAITKKLVAFHSGTIQVNSAPGAGTTVRVDLPDAEASVVAISAD